MIKGLGVELFGFKTDEVPIRDFFVPCYLVAHPKGTLMWDVGVIPDSAFKGDGAPVTEARVNRRPGRCCRSSPRSATRPPTSRTWHVALPLRSHRQRERVRGLDLARARWPNATRCSRRSRPASSSRRTFSALKTAKTTILDNDDYDVFGDGTVVIKSAPGHTPGHQVLFLKLKKTGPLLVAGDLYHYPEEQTMNRFPSFEFNKEQSAVSRANIDAFLKKTKAQMWISHDAATNAKLKKAPAYYD